MKPKSYSSRYLMIGKGLFQMGTGDCLVIVRVMPADLIVVRLENHEVIGMDWLGKNRATLDCHWSWVQIESGCGPPIRFQSICPTSGCLVISAIQVERMLENGCEAYWPQSPLRRLKGLVTRTGFCWSVSSRTCFGRYREFPLIGLIRT